MRSSDESSVVAIACGAGGSTCSNNAPETENRASSSAGATRDQPFKVQCVVPLYYPSQSVWERWIRWAPNVDCLMLFDNTPSAKDQPSPTGELPGNVTYATAGTNRGVATAFNQAALLAKHEKCTHLLTFDQDSEPAVDFVATLYGALTAEEWVQTGLVGPQHTREDIALMARAGATPVEWLMSSGCLVNLEAWRAVGGYNEQFFMDHVDTDFCLKLRRAGYRVMLCNSVVMPHRLGASRVHVFFGWRFLVNHHPPARRYTMARNTISLCRLHGGNFPGLRYRQMRDMTGLAVKILLFEPRKRVQLSALLHGLWDGFRERQVEATALDGPNHPEM